MIISISRFISVATLLLLTFAGTTADAQQLSPHEASYKIKAGIARGELTTRLTVVDGQYVATHTATPRGLAGLIAGGEIVEQSVFTIAGTTVRGNTYDSADSLSNDKGAIALVFDWAEKQLSGTVTPEDAPTRAVALSLAEPLHDRVAIQYQLMLDLAINSDTKRYQMFDQDGNKVLNISRVGERTIKVGRKTYETIGIQHQATGSSRTTTLWCVPALGYLPAMIEQRRKGKLKVRVSLTDYTPLPDDNVSELPPTEVSAS